MKKTGKTFLNLHRDDCPWLLVGYFGHGNVGDELILHMLRSHLGPGPYLSGRFPSVQGAVGRFHFIQILLTLLRCRGLILGGGELFQQSTSFRSLCYYWLIPLMAWVMRRRWVAFSLSVDPGLGPVPRALTAWLLRGAEAVWVRDAWTFDSLESHGVRCRRMPDVVWALPVRPVGKSVPSERKKIVWILRYPTSLRIPWGKIQPEWRHGFMTFQPMKEWEGLLRFAEHAPPGRREAAPQPLGSVDILREYDLVVTQRYHGIILAVLAGRPVIAVPGHGKVRLLAEELGLSVVAPSEVEHTDWDKLWTDALARGPVSADARPEMARRALSHLASLANPSWTDFDKIAENMGSH